MLIITRRVGEAVHIGDDVTVEVTAIRGNQVRIAIDAPPHVQILREELYRPAGMPRPPRLAQPAPEPSTPRPVIRRRARSG